MSKFSIPSIKRSRQVQLTFQKLHGIGKGFQDLEVKAKEINNYIESL